MHDELCFPARGHSLVVHQPKEESQMLTYTTPATVRPIPEEATGQRHGRTPGAIGLILDGDVLAEWMQNEGLTDGRDVHVGELLLIQSADEKSFGIIGHEGVGVKRDAESETF